MKMLRADTDPIVRTTVRLQLPLLNAAKHRGIMESVAGGGYLALKQS